MVVTHSLATHLKLALRDNTDWKIPEWEFSLFGLPEHQEGLGGKEEQEMGANYLVRLGHLWFFTGWREAKLGLGDWAKIGDRLGAWYLVRVWMGAKLGLEME